jgi:hypothetical protein
MKQFHSLPIFAQENITENKNIRKLQNSLEETLVQLTNSLAFTVVDDILQIKSKLGVGTSEVPVDNIGSAIVVLHGTDSSVDGPHFQVTTTKDNYPTLQQLNWSHDNINFAFDAFYNGAWKSSDAGSNFLFAKNNDTLAWKYDSNVAQGETVSWNNGIVMDNAGNVGIGTTPSYPLHLTTSSGTDAEIRAQTANGSDNAKLTLLAAGNQEWHIESDRSNNLMQIGSSVRESIKINGSNGIVTLPTGYLSVGDSSKSTEAVAVEIGGGRTDNGYALIDLVGDTTYTDYGLRVARLNTGANTTSTIEHRGTGALTLNAIDAGTIGFYTNNTFAATIDSSQNVGIGVSPSYRLDVADNVADWVANFFNDGNSSERNGIKVQCGADDQSTGAHYYFGAYDGDGQAEGYLRVASGTFELIQASSEKRKTNITFSNTVASDILSKLQIRQFNRVKDNMIGDSHRFGFVAEEVEKIFPEMVAIGPCGGKFISESRLISVLVKGWQELKREVDDLKEQLDICKNNQ